MSKGLSFRKLLTTRAKPWQLGMAAALLVASVVLLTRGLIHEWAQGDGVPLSVPGSKAKAKSGGPAAHLTEKSGWHWVRVDDKGWTTGAVGSYEALGRRLAGPSDGSREILIPIFPTVYAPRMEDKIYYDAILQSEIQPGDKVLVIGTGSGADSWVASLKTKAPIYVVEINPMAVVNARATARLGGFTIKPVVGDMTKVKLPPAYRDFDYVLWNMPYVWKPDPKRPKRFNYEGISFHDGDTGGILKRLLKRLPKLLKPGGKAYLLNSHYAKQLIRVPGTVTRSAEPCTLFIVPRPKG